MGRLDELAARSGCPFLSRKNVAAQGDVSEAQHAVPERHDPQDLSARIRGSLATTD